jgi:hypothetical protein
MLLPEDGEIIPSPKHSVLIKKFYVIINRYNKTIHNYVSSCFITTYIASYCAIYVVIKHVET